MLTAWDEEDQLVGLAPWILARESRGPLTVRRVAFLFYRPSAHLDILARATEKEAVCAAFLSYLADHQGKWDILDLKGLASDSVLNSTLAGAPGRYLEREKIVCPVIACPGEWDVYYSRLSKKLRKNLRYYRNRLARESKGNDAFRLVTQPEELSRAMDTLFALNRKRRHSVRRWSSFENKRFVQFNYEIARLAMDKGWLRLFELSVAGRTIASLCCFCYREVFYAYQMGFDPDWASCSPALLLIAHAIRQAIDEGAHTVDLLPGTEHHKVVWTESLHADAHLMLSNTWRGHLWMVGAFSYDKIISWVRKRVPETTRRRINLYVSRKRH
jgi:hypothetical protein